MRSIIDYMVVKRENERKEKRKKLIDEIMLGLGFLFVNLLVLKVIL